METGKSQQIFLSVMETIWLKISNPISHGNIFSQPYLLSGINPVVFQADSAGVQKNTKLLNTEWMFTMLVSSIISVKTILQAQKVAKGVV